MRVLVDTCVLAEVRHPNGKPAVRAAFGAIDADDMYLSVITVGEIAKGIELLPQGPKRRDLTQWLAGLRRDFGSQILTVDSEVAQIWGEITARCQIQGIVLPASDGLIAATAIKHGLHLMTRNTRHFSASGAMVVDPWPAT